MGRELVRAEERRKISIAGDISRRGNCNYAGHGESRGRDISSVAGLSTMAASTGISDTQHVTYVMTKLSGP